MTNNSLIEQSLIKDIKALRSPEGYLNAGIPNYNHLFGRDACVSALQLVDYDPSIAFHTLKTMAKYQAKKGGLMNEAYPGKMPHEHFPGGARQILSSSHGATHWLRRIYIFLFWRFPYYGSVDAGAWFIILLHRYVKKTGDEQLLRELWPAALGIISWLEARAISQTTGLVAYRRRYIFGILNQSWKDTISSKLKPPTAMVEVQGYYFEAYKCLAELATSYFENEHDAKTFAEKAEHIKQSLNVQLWNENTGYFSLAINDHGDQDTSITSNPGHLLFTGILSDEQADLVVRRLMADDLMTPFGVRTLSSNEGVFDVASYQEGAVWPFDNWVLYQGLVKLHFVKEAASIKSGLFAAYHQFGTIPELYSVSRDNTLSLDPQSCTIQAWSTGALINMTISTGPVL